MGIAKGPSNILQQSNSILLLFALLRSLKVSVDIFRKTKHKKTGQMSQIVWCRFRVFDLFMVSWFDRLDQILSLEMQCSAEARLLWRMSPSETSANISYLWWWKPVAHYFFVMGFPTSPLVDKSCPSKKVAFHGSDIALAPQQGLEMWAPGVWKQLRCCFNCECGGQNSMSQQTGLVNIATLDMRSVLLIFLGCSR